MIVMREVFKRDISTHTLTWSVTNLKGYDFMSKLISTHTLTWSVTQFTTSFPHKKLNFNSHAHVERDRIISGVYADIRNFNSHAHVERDGLFS